MVSDLAIIRISQANRRFRLNPLRMGAWFPTRHCRRSSRLDAVSIPFAWGHGFRRMSNTSNATVGFQVSIPFAWGHGFRRNWSASVGSAPFASQSPSHGGMVSDALEDLRPRTMQLSVSIPFAWGHGFRPFRFLTSKNQYFRIVVFRIPYVKLHFGRSVATPPLKNSCQVNKNKAVLHQDATPTSRSLFSHLPDSIDSKRFILVRPPEFALTAKNTRTTPEPESPSFHLTPAGPSGYRARPRLQNIGAARPEKSPPFLSTPKTFNRILRRHVGYYS